MLVALGIILIIVGAVVSFAIDTVVEGVDLRVLGYILIGGGVIALVAGAIQGAGYMSMGNRKMKSERSVSPDGNQVIEETQVK
jgi:hypothetical protein